MTAIIAWADGVILLAGPTTMSECSVWGSVVGSGLLFPDSPSHSTDGLNSLSKKILGGTGSRFSADAGEDIRRLIVFSDHIVEFEPLEPS